MKSRIVFFIVVFGLWLLLCMAFDWEHVLIGAVVACFVSLIAGDIFVTRPHVLKNPLRYLWFMYYVPLFIWECLKANLDVAYRVIHPMRPIKPGIVKVKTGLKSETGLTFLANSITLTPGTMSVDFDREKGILYIHWINVASMDIEKATERIVARFERVLAKIFE
ncbi:MAG: Na+/H+ antiporter subunit E [Chitinispirillaceae bacterium]|nr:Na+/H+ antiporter subunit E [Chitinispirillaceae bacterium]